MEKQEKRRAKDRLRKEKKAALKQLSKLEEENAERKAILLRLEQESSRIKNINDMRASEENANFRSKRRVWHSALINNLISELEKNIPLMSRAAEVNFSDLEKKLDDVTRRTKITLDLMSPFLMANMEENEETLAAKEKYSNFKKELAEYEKRLGLLEMKKLQLKSELEDLEGSLSILKKCNTVFKELDEEKKKRYPIPKEEEDGNGMTALKVLVEKVTNVYSKAEICKSRLRDSFALSLSAGCEENWPSKEPEKTLEKTYNDKLDRSHSSAVNLVKDIEEFMEVPDEWGPPEPQPDNRKENLLQWCYDKKTRDQFVIRSGSDTEVFLWNDGIWTKSDLVYKRSFRTVNFVQWSPLGTFLATVHGQGAAIWGGVYTFNRIMQYAHPQVKLIDFSPRESFLVTYSSHERSSPHETHQVVLNIFDVRTGTVMRDFKGSADEFTVGGSGSVTGVSWPVFRWGGVEEDKYFARIGKNAIYVYETVSFTLINRTSIKVENLTDFSWSPTDPVLALFVHELGGENQPARVDLIKIPNKMVLRQKNVSSVGDCKMYWQGNGDYLAVKVDRYTETKKSAFSSIEIFRMKERDVPIEIVELENKNDEIIAFAWDPKGQRFAVIHGDSSRSDVSFYAMSTEENPGRVSKLCTLEGKHANALYWAPNSMFLVLAGCKGLNGQLEFFYVDELVSVGKAQHPMATHIEWDPSGRYVATAVTSIHEMVGNGFKIWNFDGNLRYEVEKDHLFQFIWRPRPKLCAEKEGEIMKNIDEYSKKYEAEDAGMSLQLSNDVENWETKWGEIEWGVNE